MKLQVCARCKKRPAAVFITKLENDKTVQEGICLQCASELGIKPINDMLSRMGIDEEAIQNMTSEINGLMESGLVSADDGDEGGKVPTLNLGEIFGMPFGKPAPEKGDGQKKKPEGKEPPSKKLLNTYCQNLNRKAAEG